MFHMKPEIRTGPYWIVTMVGGDSAIVPADLVDSDTAPEHFADYVNGEPESAEKAEGIYGRLSAPGYMDRTDWRAFDGAKDLLSYLVSDLAVPEQAAIDAAADALDLRQCDLCRCLLQEDGNTTCADCARVEARNPSVALNADPDPVRIVYFQIGPGFLLAMFDANESQAHKSGVAYILTNRETGERIFSSGRDGNLWSPGSIDSDDAAAALCGFLFLRPGDTDSEHFEGYTEDQLAFADKWAEDLSCEASFKFGDRLAFGRGLCPRSPVPAYPGPCPGTQRPANPLTGAGIALGYLLQSDCGRCRGPKERDTMVMFTIQHKGRSVEASDEALPRTIQQLTAELGPWAEDSRVIEHGALALADVPSPIAAAPSRFVRPVAMQGPPAPIVRGVTIDAEGKDRSLADRDRAILAGFAPAQPIYARGTMVRQDGVDKGRTYRREYEALPTARDGLASLYKGIKSEEREDVVADLRSLRMTGAGALVVEGQELVLTRNAFPRLLASVGLGMGAAYLAAVDPELRALNVNRWLAGDRMTGTKAKLRTRRARGGGKEIFAVVSERYSSFDPDLLAHAIALAVEGLPGARADVVYDGQRTSVDVMWHSDVQPEKFVAGEYFRSVNKISTDDTGQGGISGYAALWQNLCLNLQIVDRAQAALFSVRHTGKVERVAEQIRIGLQRTAAAVAPFVERWNVAAREDLSKTIPAEVPEARGLTLAELMGGTFRSLIERELVPARGRAEEHVGRLLKAWEADASGAAGPNRAAVVNAITRDAHERGGDPWDREADERAGSALLWSEDPLLWAPDERKSKLEGKGAGIFPRRAGLSSGGHLERPARRMLQRRDHGKQREKRTGDPDSRFALFARARFARLRRAGKLRRAMGVLDSLDPGDRTSPRACGLPARRGGGHAQEL